jgi:phosphopantothenoylcysteine decarboxylase/phosphopantothenate--cysteine ligase
MKTVLLGITGSIAAYKACELISIFRKKGHAVRCAMTAGATHFITPLTLETLSGNKVAADMFKRPPGPDPEHISLADEADLILIAPATYNVIGKIASGISDDILTCTVAAASCPVVLAPAMNDRMYLNPVIRDKTAYLKEKGYRFIEPVEGHLACDRHGIGHLAPIREIVDRTEAVLAERTGS